MDKKPHTFAILAVILLVLGTATVCAEPARQALAARCAVGAH